MSEIEIVLTLSKPSETQLGNISISDRLSVEIEINICYLRGFIVISGPLITKK